MTYSAGVIGTGGIAGMGILGMHDADEIGEKKVRASHAGGYDTIEDIELEAVADINEETLSTFGEAWEIEPERRYTDHKSMLTKESLDVVSVCTPTYLHHRHVVDAATIGDPSVVWCEKPIASSVATGQEIIDVCREEGTELVINHSFRFTDKIQKLRSEIQDGLMGEVVAVNASFRRELLRNSTHLIDTLVYLLDAQAERVSGYVNGENDAVDALGGDRNVEDSGGGGMLVLDDGTFVTLDCTVAREHSSMMFQIIGSEGKLYLNNDDGEWRYWNLEDGTHVETPHPSIDGAWSWDTDYRDAFPNAAAHIVDLLEGQAENHSPGEDALRSIEIIIGFYISHFTGSHVSVPLESPFHDITITSW